MILEICENFTAELCCVLQCNISQYIYFTSHPSIIYLSLKKLLTIVNTGTVIAGIFELN